MKPPPPLPRGNHRGFTLIELMIVAAIVALLSAIAYPSYLSSVAKGRRAECRSGLFQSMQQQERFFTQFDTYAPFAENAANAKTKAFSGESAQASACLIQGLACTAPASTSTNQCIELRGRLVRADSGIDYLYLDSDGTKGCSISGRTTGNQTCWP